MKILQRIERALGSSLLSWVCVVVLAARSDLGLVDYLLLLVPLSNYTLKLDQIHAARMEARQGRDAQRLDGEAATAGNAAQT